MQTQKRKTETVTNHKKTIVRNNAHNYVEAAIEKMCKVLGENIPYTVEDSCMCDTVRFTLEMSAIYSGHISFLARRGINLEYVKLNKENDGIKAVFAYDYIGDMK